MSEPDSGGSAVPTPKKPGARTALVVGFGALLLLMAVICLDSLRTLSEVAASNAQIRQDYLYREQTLEQVRANLYQSGNIMRDFMLAESDAQTQTALRTQLRSVHEQTDSALAACIQSLPAAQKQPFENLSNELNLYWSTLDPILMRSAGEKKGQIDSILRNAVLLQHAHTLAIATDVSTVNASDLRDAERRGAEVFEQFRSRLLLAATTALGIGLLLAAATIIYAGQLEKSVEEKYEESLRARRELQELSKRLVDAEEQERRAISRELHDEVGQSLSALLVDVENLAAVPDEQGAFRGGLQHIKKLAETSVNEVRNMALLLRPSMLDDLGLVAAVEWQGREVSRRAGLVVETTEENVSDDLPEEYKVCMYRVVQEALNNSAKHANAKKVRVVVSQIPNRLQVSIEDDGKGFDAARVRGLGLLGMNERVTHLGGRLKVESRPGRGTRVSANLPLPNA
jgi:signal transduction histidine kinase